VEEQTVDSTFIAEEIIEEEPEPESQPVVIQRALLPSNTNSNTQGTNQGITSGLGDQGREDGYKDSDKYDGRGGKGNGPDFSLGGRGYVTLEKPKDFKERGIIIVNIEVDREGIVRNAWVKVSEISDPELKSKAVEAAKNSKFEKDPSAEELQRGTITYKFVLLK